MAWSNAIVLQAITTYTALMINTYPITFFITKLPPYSNTIKHRQAYPSLLKI